MNGENQPLSQLVVDAPVEFEKITGSNEDFGIVTDHFRGIQRYTSS